jgi:Tfp pilus assembly protein PilV
MLVRFKQADKRTAGNGVTLVELLVALCIFGLAIGGLIYGYAQINRMAEWSSMSLAAQSLASQGVEQVRCWKWDSQSSSTNIGPGCADELGLTNFIQSGSNYTLDMPSSGDPIYVTNYISVTANQPTLWPVRQIRADCVWMFPRTGQYFTNTVITVRGPDE